MLTEKLESEADDCLRSLAGLDTYDVNLSSHPKAWEALEVFARAIDALVRAECVPDRLLFSARLKIAEDASVPMDADFNRVVQSVLDHLREAAPGITAPTAKD